MNYSLLRTEQNKTKTTNQTTKKVCFSTSMPCYPSFKKLTYSLLNFHGTLTVPTTGWRGHGMEHSVVNEMICHPYLSPLSPSKRLSSTQLLYVLYHSSQVRLSSRFILYLRNPHTQGLGPCGERSANINDCLKLGYRLNSLPSVQRNSECLFQLQSSLGGEWWWEGQGIFCNCFAGQPLPLFSPTSLIVSQIVFLKELPKIYIMQVSASESVS